MHPGHQRRPGHTANGIHIKPVQANPLISQTIEIGGFNLGIIPTDITPSLIIRDDDHNIRPVLRLQAEAEK